MPIFVKKQILLTTHSQNPRLTYLHIIHWFVQNIPVHFFVRIPQIENFKRIVSPCSYHIISILRKSHWIYHRVMTQYFQSTIRLTRSVKRNHPIFWSHRNQCILWILLHTLRFLNFSFYFRPSLTRRTIHIMHFSSFRNRNHCIMIRKVLNELRLMNLSQLVNFNTFLVINKQIVSLSHSEENIVKKFNISYFILNMKLFQ